MKVTVCELRNEPSHLEAEWKALAKHTRERQSELVLLPEMPFFRWLPATADVNADAWQNSIAAHEQWDRRLHELGAGLVLATRPIVEAENRYNRSMVWERDGGQRAGLRSKCYLPDEEGFWEATWYSRGEVDFRAVDAGGIRIGFSICTEMWFFQHAREYGKQEAQLIVTPRATPGSTVDKWVAGGRATAVVSGAYCLSSNFSGEAGGSARWGGAGWIIEPEEGEILGLTSRDEPFLTADLDLGVADAAKETYPRYVIE
jgi:N-carbamoylputrescine amidase